MKKGKLVKLLLALGIGAATLFLGAAIAACDSGNGGNNSVGDEQTTPGGDEQTTPGGDNTPTTPGGDNTPTTPGGDNTPATPGGDNTPTTPGGEQTSNPVIGVVRATSEAFEEMIDGDLVELKGNTPITVDIAEGVTGEYCLYIAPPACMIYEGVGAMPYPGLVITATVGDEEYEITWTEDDGEYYFGSQLFIDFTDVTSITVEANQDVEVVMTLLDFDFNRYYVSLNFAVNGTLIGEGLGWDGVAEDTVIDEKWILDFVADVCVNCDLLGVYFDEEMTKEFPAGYVISDDAEGVIVEDYDGETVRYLELWIDLHNFLQVEYYNGDHGNGREYYVEDENETVDVDVDGICAYIDGVSIDALDGWTLSYTLLDYYYNDLKAGNAPWTLPVGYYIVRVDAAKAGQKTLSAYLYYHIEVEDENGDGKEDPPFGGNIEVSIQPQYFTPSPEEYIKVPVDDVRVYFNGQDIAHDKNWNISYLLFSLNDGQRVNFDGTGWDVGIGDYRLDVTADSDEYGHFENKAYFSVAIMGGGNPPSPGDPFESMTVIGIETKAQTIYVDDADNYMAQLYITVQFDDDSDATISLSSIIEYGGEVDVSQLDVMAAGTYTVTGTFRDFEFSFTVKVVERELVLIRSSDHVIDVEDFNDGSVEEVVYNCLVQFCYADGSIGGTPLRVLPAEDLEVNFDSVKPSVGVYTVSGRYKEFEFSFNIIVVDSSGSHEVFTVMPDEMDFYVGMSKDTIYEMYCVVYYKNGDSEYVPLSELWVNEGDVEALDLNTAGEKTLSVRYGNFLGTLTFTVVERNVVAVYAQPDLTVYLGVSAEQVLHILSCNILYDTGYMENKSLYKLGITEADLEKIGLDTVGEKTLNVTYGGIECTITFIVKELEVEFTFTGTDTSSFFALKGTPITEINVYNDWSAEVTLSGAAHPVSVQFGIIGIDEINKTFMFLNGYVDEYEIQIILICDWENFTFANIAVADLERDLSVVGSYKGQIEEKEVTFTLYQELISGSSFFVYTVDGQQYVLLYIVLFPDVFENRIYIYGFGEFDLVGNTFTAVEY